MRGNGSQLKEGFRQGTVKSGYEKGTEVLAQDPQRWEGGGAPSLQTPVGRLVSCECRWSCGCPCSLRGVRCPFRVSSSSNHL